MPINIKVLGPGCNNCHLVEEHAREAVAQLGLEAEIEHVTDARHRPRRVPQVRFAVHARPGDRRQADQWRSHPQRGRYQRVAGKRGQPTCFTFALKLIAGQQQPAECPPLLEPAFAGQLAELHGMLGDMPAFR